MRYRFGSKRRDAVWSNSCFAAYMAGSTDGSQPTCNLCGAPVNWSQPWDISHVGAPKALNMPTRSWTGVAHRACNRRDNNLNVTPMMAKIKRVRAKALGAKGPGLGRHPMPCGRRSNFSKAIGGKVRPRLGIRERAILMRHRRAIVKVPVEELLS